MTLTPIFPVKITFLRTRSCNPVHMHVVRVGSGGWVATAIEFLQGSTCVQKPISWGQFLGKGLYHRSKRQQLSEGTVGVILSVPTPPNTENSNLNKCQTQSRSINLQSQLNHHHKTPMLQSLGPSPATQWGLAGVQLVFWYLPCSLTHSFFSPLALLQVGNFLVPTLSTWVFSFKRASSRGRQILLHACSRLA